MNGKMRLVVTGKQGQVARSLGEAGVSDVAVIAVGRPELDLERTAEIAPALAAARPDVIVNAAAFTAVDQAETRESDAQLINAAAAGAVAAAARELGVPVIHLSTDYVFDGRGEHAYREDDPVAPLGAYGRSKLAGERAIAAVHGDHVILRTAWVYSPFGNNFVKTMLRLGETRSEINVVADQHGSPTYAPDIATSVIAIARRILRDRNEAPLRGTFHMTGSGETTWADFAEAIFSEAKAHGRQPVRVNPITTAEYPTPARRPANSRLDCSKLARVYGLTLPDWRVSVRECVNRLLI